MTEGSVERADSPWEAKIEARRAFAGQSSLLRAKMDAIVSRMEPASTRSPLAGLASVDHLVNGKIDDLLAMRGVGSNTLVKWLKAATEWARERTSQQSAITMIEPALLGILQHLGESAANAVHELPMGSWTSPLHADPWRALPAKDLPFDTPDLIIEVVPGAALLDEMIMKDGSVLTTSARRNGRYVRLKVKREEGEDDAALTSRAETFVVDGFICPVVQETAIAVGRHSSTSITRNHAILIAETLEQVDFTPTIQEVTATEQDIPDLDEESMAEMLVGAYEHRECGQSRDVIILTARRVAGETRVFGKIEGRKKSDEGLASIPIMRWNAHDSSWWIDLKNATMDDMRRFALLHPALATKNAGYQATAWFRPSLAGWNPMATISLHPVLHRLVQRHRISLQSLHLMPEGKYAGPCTWAGGTTSWRRNRQGSKDLLGCLPASMPAAWIGKKDAKVLCTMLQLGNGGSTLRERDGVAIVTIPMAGIGAMPMVGDDLGVLLGIEWLEGILIESIEPAFEHQQDHRVTIDPTHLNVAVPYAEERKIADAVAVEPAALFALDLADRINRQAKPYASGAPCTLSVQRHEAEDHETAQFVIEVEIPSNVQWSYVLKQNPMHMRSVGQNKWRFHHDNMDVELLAKAIGDRVRGAVVKGLDDDLHRDVLESDLDTIEIQTEVCLDVIEHDARPPMDWNVPFIPGSIPDAFDKAFPAPYDPELGEDQEDRLHISQVQNPDAYCDDSDRLLESAPAETADAEVLLRTMDGGYRPCPKEDDGSTRGADDGRMVEMLLSDVILCGMCLALRSDWSDAHAIRMLLDGLNAYAASSGRDVLVRYEFARAAVERHYKIAGGTVSESSSENADMLEAFSSALIRFALASPPADARDLARHVGTFANLFGRERKDGSAEKLNLMRRVVKDHSQQSW